MKKIYFLIFTFFLYQNSVYSKVNVYKEFNQKYLSDYFSALFSFNNQNKVKALKYFNSSKFLINQHDSFLKKYVFSLVENRKVKQAIKEIKLAKKNKNKNFFEANILLVLDSLLNNNKQNTLIAMSNLKTFKNEDAYEVVIYETLKSYVELFDTRNTTIEKNDFGKFSIINSAFQNCYLNSENTNTIFVNLINASSTGRDYSRYLFFYFSNLLDQGDIETIEDISSTIDPINNGLLISQTKIWIDNKNYEKLNKLFSCKNEYHLLGEFFFLISNLYSADENYIKSNFYLNISNYLNPGFYFNMYLLAENYFITKNYTASKNILKKFTQSDEVFYWHRIKRISKIIEIQENEFKSLNYIEQKFKQIKKPSTKIIYDMANIYKNFKEYKKAIELYTLLINEVDNSTEVYADLLYKRGGSFERIGNYKKSDNDLIKSLEIVPDDPYVMNYLAYSWLERKYKIDEALKMLKEAYDQKENDPYIIDSIGWAYFLIEDYEKAEEYLIQAVELMPDDPIVNDHYGDILWMLNKKMQARYFWKNVLKLKDTEDFMKKNIREKLLKGLNKT
tara:strand:- start:1536 stop:3221 length:1686 start_codon:yes stop_codon:yes gene_type:complete